MHDTLIKDVKLHIDSIEGQNEEINIYKLKVHMRPILSSIISTTKRYQVDKALNLWRESLEKERRKFIGETKKNIFKIKEMIHRIFSVKTTIRPVSK